MSYSRFINRKTVNLDIFNKCTLECSKCYRQFALQKDFITTANFPGAPITDDEFKKVVSFYDYLSFCGQVSDPLMHPKLSYFLEQIYEQRKVAKVNTAISQPTLKTYIKCFKANPEAYWTFGIDGLPKDSHKYRINQDGIKLFNVMMTARKYLALNRIKWQYIIFNYNENDMNQAREIARREKIKIEFIMSGRYTKDDPLRPSEKFMIERPEWKQ